jgi:hypothetical protein
MTFLIRSDCAVRSLDREGLEIKANPLASFVPRAKPRIVSEVGGIPRDVTAPVDAARGDLDNIPVVDISAALRCQIRNDPEKSKVTALFLSWTFPGDENLASSPPSPQR